MQPFCERSNGFQSRANRSRGGSELEGYEVEGLNSRKSRDALTRGYREMQ